MENIQFLGTRMVDESKNAMKVLPFDFPTDIALTRARA